MKCNCKGIACLMLGGENYTIDVAGKRWHFEMHPQYGPAITNARGDISAHQPGPRAPFWTAVTLWSQQGRKVKGGLCVWTAPPKEKLVHLGGRHYALAGSALAKKFKSKTDAGQSSPARTTRKRTMRTLDEHKINPANDKLKISVVDEPGAGGANHRYDITGFDESLNQSTPEHEDIVPGVTILFQNGPIPEVGVNGVTHEALLAIVADRLRSFQKGPFACKANACALTHIEEAQHWLQQRTIERMRRGVEGTHTV